MAKQRTLALAAGGTAGHVMIGIAIADAFRSRLPDLDIVFLGTAHGTETTNVPARGYPLELLPGAPFKRQRMRGRVEALRDGARGVAAGRTVLRKIAPQLVIGTGGYASVGALGAARSLRCATAIHEANAVPGSANRLLGRIVDRVYLSTEHAIASFHQDRCRVVGTPLRDELSRLAGLDRTPPYPARAARVLVTAGSEGSPFLDREVPRLLGELERSGVAIDARHQVGLGDRDVVRASYRELGVNATVDDFIDDMAAAYEWADLAIACCGAGTIAELAAGGLPSLLVPLAGASDDHQNRNAEAFARSERLWIVPEEAWELGAVTAEAVRILRDPVAWQTMSAAMRRLATADAADRLVSDCVDWMAGRW